MWNAKTIKHATEIAQSIALVLAVAIGGVWTLYVFTALHQREQARLETEKLIIEKDKLQSDLKRELQDRAILDLKLALSQPDWPERSHLVQASITMMNNGNRLEAMKLNNPPLVVYAMKLGQDGVPELKGPLKVSQLKSPSVKRASQKKQDSAISCLTLQHGGWLSDYAA